MQRFMIAAIQDLAREPNQEASGMTAAYLDACNLLFEQGLLSRQRINNRDSPVLANKGGCLSLKNGVLHMMVQCCWYHTVN